MDAKFTPGPWVITYDNDTGPEDGGFWQWLNVGPARVDLPSHGADQSTSYANARLIAAAPDLLEALQGLLAERISHSPAHLAARAAIAKATGGTP